MIEDYNLSVINHNSGFPLAMFQVEQQNQIFVIKDWMLTVFQQLDHLHSIGKMTSFLLTFH